MSKVQSNASRGGEFANRAIASCRNFGDLVSQLKKDSAARKPVAFSCWPESALASGCDSGAVFFGEVAQQGLLAQQLGLHAFWLAAIETAHDRAETGIAATGSIIATASEIVIPLSMLFSHSIRGTRRPRQRQSFQTCDELVSSNYGEQQKQRQREEL